jgi:phytoene synthase
MTAIVDQSRQILATHARSFRWGALLLAPNVRDDAAVLYAFCRTVDDLVDEGGPIEALDHLQAELAGLEPPSPLIAAFLDVAGRSGLPLAAAEELIQGVRGDQGRVRIADDAALLRYSYQVAGTVGLMMCGVLGVRDPMALAHAIDLGVGMQITNICRDVKADAGIDRVYLPESRLRAAGIDPEALVRGELPPGALRPVIVDLLAVAEQWYASGEAGLRYIPARNRLAIRVAGRLYRGIGRRLLRQGGDPWLGRTIVPSWEKASLAIGAVLTWQDPIAPHSAELHRPLAGLPGVHPVAD